MLATSEDSRWAGTVGAVGGTRMRLLHRYLDHVTDLIPTSPAIYRRFQASQHLMQSPAVLFHPSVAARVLARALRFGSLRRPQGHDRPRHRQSQIES
jgi:hypothetical protein